MNSCISPGTVGKLIPTPSTPTVFPSSFPSPTRNFLLPPISYDNFTDECLHLTKLGTKLNSEGIIKTEVAEKLKEPTLQPEAVKHLHMFFTKPRLIEAKLTEKIRQDIRNEFPIMYPELYGEFFKLPFMTSKSDLIFSANIIPGEYLLKVMEAAQAAEIKLIGGESRRALFTTFVQMVEALCEQSLKLPQSKIDQYNKSTPDWDFIVPYKVTGKTNGPIVDKIIPQLLYKQISTEHPKFEPLFINLISRILCKSEFIFEENRPPITSIVLGSTHNNKIDITVTSDSYHNQIFELGALGLAVSKSTLQRWVKDIHSKPEKNDQVHIDFNHSFHDKGHQAALDNILGYLHCSQAKFVNKKGFLSYMGWLSKGAFCTHNQLSKDFLYKIDIKNLAYYHNLHYLSHESASQTSLIATLLNTLSTVDEVYPGIILSGDRQLIFETFKTDLKEHFSSKSAEPNPSIFTLLKPVFGDLKISIDLVLDWLSLAAYIKLLSTTTSDCKVISRVHEGKPALQLVDGHACMLPYLAESHLQRILASVSDKSRAISNNALKLLTSLNLRLWSDDVLDVDRIKKYTEFDLEVLANYGVEFLNHPSPLLKQIGFQLLSIHHLRTGETRFIPELLAQVPVLFFGNTLFLTETQITKNLQILVSAAYPTMEIKELVNTNLSIEENTIKWIIALNKSNQTELIKKSMQLWTEVSPSLKPIVKSQTGVEIMESLLPGQPNYMLAVFLTVSLTTLQSYRILGSVIKVLSSSPIKIATVSLLHKSLLKMVEAYKSQPTSKNNTAIDLYNQNYLWAISKLAESFPVDAISLAASMIGLHLLKPNVPESLKELISICSRLKECTHKVQFWNAIEAAGCQLKVYHGSDKKKCLIEICEGLSKEKSEHLKKFLDLANAEELGENLTKRLKAVISNYFQTVSINSEVPNSVTLESQLEPEQRRTQIIKRTIANLNPENLLEAEKTIRELYPVSTLAQQNSLVELSETILNQYIYADAESDPNFTHLEFFLNFYLTLDQAKPQKQLTKNILLFLTRQISEMPLNWKGLALPIIELFKTHLNTILRDFNALGLENECCNFLKQYCFRKLPIEYTEEFASCALAPLKTLLYSSSLNEDTLQFVEQTLKALKLYRFAALQSNEQRRLYCFLLESLLNAKSPKAPEWLMRLFQLHTPNEPLQAHFIENWIKQFDAQKSLGSLEFIYAKRECIDFISTYQRAQIMLDILNRAQNASSYPICAHILTSEHSGLNAHCSINLGSLAVTILEGLKPSEENLTLRVRLLELFTPSQNHLWIFAFKEIIQFSNQTLKDQAFQLYEKFKTVNKNNRNGVLGKCFLYALQAITEPGLLKNILQSASTIDQYFIENQTQDLHDSFKIIFEKNLSYFLLCKNEEEMSNYLFLILGTRSSLCCLPPWCDLDDLMLKYLVPLKNVTLFEKYLQYLSRRFEQLSKKEVNQAFQDLVAGIPKEHISHRILLCRSTASQWVGTVDIYPLLKAAANESSIPFRIGAGWLLLGSMELIKPQSKIDTVITYCLISKLISDKEYESNLLAAKILQHPLTIEWFGPDDLANLWEQMLLLELQNGLTHHNIAVCVIAIQLLCQKMHFIHGRAKKFDLLCGLAVKNLIRFLLDFKHLSVFHVQLTSLFRELVNYRGPITLAEKCTPLAVPGTGFLESITKSPRELYTNLQKIEIVDLKTVVNDPREVFLKDDDAFSSFVIDESSNMDDPSRLDFYIVCNPNLFARLVKKLPPSFRGHVFETPLKTIVDKEEGESFQLETLEYHFSEPHERAFYVKNIGTLFTHLLCIKTNDYYIKRYVITATARLIIFLINHYKDYENAIFDLFQSFLLAPVSVDCPLEEFKTEPGKEHIDQTLYTRHTELCQQILHMLLDKEKWDLHETHQNFLFQALIVLYPEEIHIAQNIPTEKQAYMIGSVLATLLEGGSVLHYYRALLIMIKIQNLILLHLPSLLVLYQKIVNGVKRNPYYLIHEKRTIHIDEKDHCSYFNKQPLFRIALKCLEMNYRLSGEDRFTEMQSFTDFRMWIHGSAEVTGNYAHMLLELLENPLISIDRYDALGDLLKFYRKRAELGALLISFLPFHACLQKTIPIVFDRIARSGEGRALTYRRYYIMDLFIIPINLDFENRKTRARTLNLWCNKLLTIGDREITKEVLQSVKNFMKSGFYDGCHEEKLLAEQVVSVAVLNGGEKP